METPRTEPDAEYFYSTINCPAINNFRNEVKRKPFRHTKRRPGPAAKTGSMHHQNPKRPEGIAYYPRHTYAHLELGNVYLY
jgi:hypothetical protein